MDLGSVSPAAQHGEVDQMRDDLKQAYDRARTKFTLRNGPKMETAEKSLSPQEEVLQVLRCRIGSKPSLLILTDRNVHVLGRGGVFGDLAAQGEVIPIATITGVDRRRNPMVEWTITITRASNVDVLDMCDERESETFIAQARDLIHRAQVPAQSSDTQGASGDDVMDQIGKLKALLDAGALTEEEFAEKKAELLKRI